MPKYLLLLFTHITFQVSVSVRSIRYKYHHKHTQVAVYVHTYVTKYMHIYMYMCITLSFSILLVVLWVLLVAHILPRLWKTKSRISSRLLLYGCNAISVDFCVISLDIAGLRKVLSNPHVCCRELSKMTNKCRLKRRNTNRRTQFCIYGNEHMLTETVVAGLAAPVLELSLWLLRLGYMPCILPIALFLILLRRYAKVSWLSRIVSR